MNPTYIPPQIIIEIIVCISFLVLGEIQIIQVKKQQQWHKQSWWMAQNILHVQWESVNYIIISACKVSLEHSCIVVGDGIGFVFSGGWKWVLWWWSCQGLDHTSEIQTT